MGYISDKKLYAPFNRVNTLELEYVQQAKELAIKIAAGEAIFEIGRRLKGVRDNPKDYGFADYRDWERWCNDELSITRGHANRFIKVTERFTNSETPGSRLPTSITILADLASFTDEELTQPIPQDNGETKTLLEMSRREIADYKRRVREAEAKAQQAESDAEVARRDAEIKARQLARATEPTY